MHSFSNRCDGVHYPCMDVFKGVGLGLAKRGSLRWCVLSVHSCVSVTKACFWSNRWPRSNTADNNLPYLWNKRNPFAITAGHIPTGHIAVATTAGKLASLKVQSVCQKPVPVRGGVHELQLSVKDLLSLSCPWRNRKDTWLTEAFNNHAHNLFGDLNLSACCIRPAIKLLPPQLLTWTSKTVV